MRHGVGLGLRWDFLDELLEMPDPGVTFVEVSPENYMRRGGYFPAALGRVRERFAVLSHGLSMSVGGTDPFDDAYFASLRRFLDEVGARDHSEHLCWSGTSRAMLHELLPIPFTRQAARHTAARLREASDRLERPVAIENVTYYAALGRPEMSEADFVNEVLDASGAGLLLDVNNVFVNARNHGHDPLEFLGQMPLDRVVQMHVAGHDYNADFDLIIDTHGAPTPDPVVALMAWVVERRGPVPVVLERDQEIPPLGELLAEVRSLQAAYDQALDGFRRQRPEHAAR
ncbi:MAG: DUF692 domain-containing protein [Myxococcales bacterium]|nr:MAG: DUF692 domain-containing protein [Myxococcales bacterium]